MIIFSDASFRKKWRRRIYLFLFFINVHCMICNAQSDGYTGFNPPEDFRYNAPPFKTLRGFRKPAIHLKTRRRNKVRTSCILPPISSEKTYSIKCPTGSKDCPNEPGKSVSCGTVITFQCNKEQSFRINGDNSVSTCSRGTWQPDLPKCQTCGRMFGVSIPLMRGGKPETFGASPWHVAIFDMRQSNEPILICGGTIVSQHMVISAAHCFFDAILQKFHISGYEIVVAKVTRNYVKDNAETKTYKIKKLFAPSEIEYTGASTNYAADIVILQTAEKISFSQAVLPACINWTDTKRFVQNEDSRGKVAGWGETEEKQPSNVLLASWLPYISYRNCRQKVSEDFATSIAIDKFCGGEIKGAGARLGDSGGGFLFPDLGTGLLYLRGIVSNKDGTTGEKETAIAAFTDIALYVNWIYQVRLQIEREELY